MRVRSCSVLRKLLTILNAMMRTNTWRQPNQPGALDFQDSCYRLLSPSGRRVTVRSAARPVGGILSDRRHLRLIRLATLPPLAWCAVVRSGGEATVLAGDLVEETEQGFF